MISSRRFGRYEIIDHLATGGMGEVYLALATGPGAFERRVVVKTLEITSAAADHATVTMFLDEARLAGALHHQYIAPTYEVGRTDDGRYFLVMDYVDGETAHAVFRRSRERAWPLPLGFSLTTVSCIASALGYAHSLCAADGTPLAIVHRDVSLSNVMIGFDGGVKLIDFGIAKAATHTTRSPAGTLKGKVGYIAPEQVRSSSVDHRADIFALGIVLYELTTSVRAFPDSFDLATLHQIAKAELTPPRRLVATYPQDLEAIVMKALAVAPDDRFQDAQAMARSLATVAGRLGVTLGHGAIADVMNELFEASQHRFARGSCEIDTSPVTKVDLEAGTMRFVRPGDEPTEPRPPMLPLLSRLPIGLPLRPMPRPAAPRRGSWRWFAVACVALGVVFALLAIALGL